MSLAGNVADVRYNGIESNQIDAEDTMALGFLTSANIFLGLPRPKLRPGPSILYMVTSRQI